MPKYQPHILLSGFKLALSSAVSAGTVQQVCGLKIVVPSTVLRCRRN